MPKVSVCIPSYNQVEYLKKCIDSLLAQSFTDFEIVLTDDSPGDMVKDLVFQYNLPGKINYHKNQPSLGSPGNWNAAIGRSTGEYIKILHHDDWLSDESSLLKFVRLLDVHPEADFAFCASNIFYPHAVDGVHRISLDDVDRLRENPLLLYGKNLVGGPSATIYKRASAPLFDTELKWLVDVDFYIRIIARNRRFVYSSESLVTTSAIEGRITEECIDNRDVEVPEYLHVLRAIATNKDYVSKRAKRQCIKEAIRILGKYGIRSDDKVLDDKGIPGMIRFYLGVKEVFPLGARALLKLM